MFRTSILTDRAFSQGIFLILARFQLWSFTQNHSVLNLMSQPELIIFFSL